MASKELLTFFAATLLQGREEILEDVLSKLILKIITDTTVNYLPKNRLTFLSIPTIGIEKPPFKSDRNLILGEQVRRQGNDYIFRAISLQECDRYSSNRKWKHWMRVIPL